MKTIIAGSRTFTDYDLLDILLSTHSAVEGGWIITEVVSGHAPGADTLGERWAAGNDLPVRVFPADWNTYGKVAGHIRNGQMADYADALIAFWDGESRGTANMILQAHRKGLRVIVRIIK